MTHLLIIGVVILGVILIAQLAKIYQLTSNLSGRIESDIPDRDNRINAKLLYLFPVVYFAFFIWLIVAYNDEMLPVSASAHGVATDKLLDVNWLILAVVFFITNILLFYFAGKYYHRKGNKAYYQTHDNRLELYWTVIPAVVMMGLIVYGLNVWNNITAPADPNAMHVELYAKQFDWTARYPGADKELGATDFRLINGTNPLGIVTKETIATRLNELAELIAEEEKALVEKVLPDDKVADMEDQIEAWKRTRSRIINLRTLMEQDIAEKGPGSLYNKGADDIVTKEFHLPVNKEVKLVFRSRDVIHSAYLPHLRTQMNCVPGMTTTFKLTPTITTDSMRLITDNTDFNYILLCNKICGASHYNMQMELIVEDAGSYAAWAATQTPFVGGEEEKENDPAKVDKIETAKEVLDHTIEQVTDSAVILNAVN